jgi:hypothetical protein
MNDLLSDLPTLRPAEVGRRWFGKATADFTGTGVKLGKVKLIAHVGTTIAQRDITLGGSAVEMRFLRQEGGPIALNTYLGATRDEAGNLAIDYQVCS